MTSNALSALLRFADAIHAGDAAEIAGTRERVVRELSVEAAVDAAAIVGTFEMADRMADATGLELDPPYAEATPYRPSAKD